MLFYCAMREKLVDLGEEFNQNYRHVVIRDMLVVDRTIKDESSILLPINKMEVDEDIVKNDCVICLEELGMERELLCTPCSYMFHGDCIMVRERSFFPCLPS
ncbi:hypothetical protein KY285_025841 [Solanum tuberosum]|nr:hypothetical protein KY285_025841 [Solanum tuberosum]